MKTVKLFLTCIFVFGIFLSSCEKEKMTFQDSESPGIAADLSTLTVENIGDYHNQKLKEFYLNLKTKIDHLGYNSFKFSDIDQSFYDVVISEIKGENAADLIAIGNKEYERHNTAKSLSEYKAMQYFSIMNSADFSTAFKAYYSDFISQTSGVKNVEQKDVLCKNYRIIIESTLSGREREIAKASINVFNSSYQYWLDNLGNWKLLSAQCGQVIFGDDVTPQSIAGADLAGAITGYLWGGLWGSVIGSVTASIAAAIDELRRHLLPV